MSIPNMYPYHTINLKQLRDQISNFFMRVVLQKPRKK